MSQVSKGQNVFLNPIGSDAENLLVEISFVFTGTSACEADASAFVLGEDRKIRTDVDFIFYNQRKDSTGGFIQLKEREANVPAGFQQFEIDLARVPNSVQGIAFCLTLYEAEVRKQSFGILESLLFRVCSSRTGQELLRFEAGADFSTETALHLGEIYRRNNEWRFRGVGQGYAGGLEKMAGQFGVNLESPRVVEQDVEEPAIDSQVPKTLVDLDAQGDKEEDQEVPTLSKRKRRSSADILTGHAQEIRNKMKPILAQIDMAVRNGVNESSSRLILDKILQEVLGYTLAEIKPEQNIQGRPADYVLSPGGTDTIVIEAKRAGLALRDKQIYQASGYAVHSGISWALLTNVAIWHLYKVVHTGKVEAHLVFTIDLHKGLTDDAAYYFALISRAGIMRKTQLERLWLTRRALSQESLISALLNDDVLTRMRNVISRENGIHLDLADVRAAVEYEILKLQ
jgi:stress response protein SCP2